MKKIVSAILILCMVLSFTACSSSKKNSTSGAQNITSGAQNITKAADKTTKDDFSIGFIFMSLKDSSLIRIKEDCEATCKEQNIKFTAVDSNSDSATQISEIENMVAVGVDAIIIQAVDTKAVTPYLKKAMEKGIKVVAFGIQTEVYDVWYRNDPEEIGTVVGQMTADWIKANKSGKAKIGMLGYPKMVNFVKRADAAKALLQKECPDSQIVSEAAALSTEEAMTAVENMLQANKDIDVIVSFSDGAAMGANEAFKAAGKDKAAAAIFGSDISSTGAEKIISKEFYYGSTDVSSLVLGKTAVNLCVSLIKGEKIDGLSDKNELFMDVNKVTAENASDYIKK